MEPSLSELYEKYLVNPEETLVKLRSLGYYAPLSTNLNITSMEDFKKFFLRTTECDKEALKNAIRLIFKKSMSKEELITFLQMGDTSLNSQELSESLRFLPFNEDKSIFVEDLINCLISE